MTTLTDTQIHRYTDTLTDRDLDIMTTAARRAAAVKTQRPFLFVIYIHFSCFSSLFNNHLTLEVFHQILAE